jgi:hypothetical protein
MFAAGHDPVMTGVHGFTFHAGTGLGRPSFG